jgi:hypothetical protein
MGAQNAMSGSIAISGIRCLITYILFPLLGPVAGLGGVGPVIGLVLGAVSLVFVVFSMRRFFAAGHRWRWAYGSVGAAIIVLVVVQSFFDIRHLVTG